MSCEERVEGCEGLLEALVLGNSDRAVPTGGCESVPEDLGRRRATGSDLVVKRSSCCDGDEFESLVCTSPVAVTSQELLIRRWLEFRLDSGGSNSSRHLAKLLRDAEDRPLYEALFSGVILFATLDPAERGRKKHALLASRRIRRAQMSLRKTTGAGADVKQVTTECFFREFEHNLELFCQLADRVLDRGGSHRRFRSSHRCPRLMFLPCELLLLRDYPRVLRSLAVFAAQVDPDALARAAAAVPSARTHWHLKDEPNESWPGDARLQSLLRAYRVAIEASFHQRLAHNSTCGDLDDDAERSVCIVVCGSAGAGKSATINSLIGRVVCSEHHSLACIPDAKLATSPRAKLELLERELQMRLQPARLASTGPRHSARVLPSVVKAGGAVFRVLEVPSMERFLIGGAVGMTLRRTHVTQLGDLKTVRTAIEQDGDLGAHAVLLVERLDDVRLPACIETFRNARALYGDRVWERAIVVLTHATAMGPTRSESSQAFVRSRIRTIRAAIQCAAVPPPHPLNIVGAVVRFSARAVQLTVTFFGRHVFRRGPRLQASSGPRGPRPVFSAGRSSVRNAASSVPIVLVENGAIGADDGVGAAARERGLDALYSELRLLAVDATTARTAASLGRTQSSDFDGNSQRTIVARLQPRPSSRRLWLRESFVLLVVIWTLNKL